MVYKWESVRLIVIINHTHLLYLSPLLSITFNIHRSICLVVKVNIFACGAFDIVPKGGIADMSDGFGKNKDDVPSDKGELCLCYRY